MPVPNTFANATSAIPLSQLDNNFATAITLGNTAIQLGNTVTTLNNMTMANVTISSVASTFPNSYLTNTSVTIGNTAVTLGGTQSTFGNVTFTNVTISSVSTPITAAQGGTGLTTLTANNVLVGNGTGSVTFVAPGTNGNVLTSNGTAWTSAALAAGGGLTLLATVSPSGVNTVDVTGLTSSKQMIIVFVPTLASSDTLNMLISVDNGASFPGTSYAVTTSSSSTPTSVINIYNSSINAVKTLTRIVSTAAANFREGSSTINAGTINAFRFSTQGGANFSSGSIYVYGVN